MEKSNRRDDRKRAIATAAGSNNLTSYNYNYNYKLLVLVGSLLCLCSSANAFENVCKEPFLCYECSSFRANESVCEDPFNVTEHDNLVRKSECKDACVKWVIKETPESKEKVIRTCSSQLDIRFPINFVCIHETRSGYGSLCFCNKDLCNGASVSRLTPVVFASCVILTLLLLVGRIPFKLTGNTW